MKSWKLTEIKLVKQNLHMTDKELAKIFGVSKSSVEALRVRNGLLKPREQCFFQKGHTSWNKGKKYNAGGRSIETRFKKGNRPVNHRKVGEIFTDCDHGRQSLFIKTETNRHYSYGRFLYEKHFGVKLTTSEIVRFRDGNQLNCIVENLLMITRAQNARMNANNKKSSDTMKKVWATVKTFEDFGIESKFIKLKSKRA